MNWTEIVGGPRPYGSVIVYECTMKGWGYMHNGFNQTVATCLNNGEWNVTDVPSCISKYKITTLLRSFNLLKNFYFRTTLPRPATSNT